jgi:hypothetical protein
MAGCPALAGFLALRFRLMRLRRASRVNCRQFPSAVIGRKYSDYVMGCKRELFALTFLLISLDDRSRKGKDRNTASVVEYALDG